VVEFQLAPEHINNPPVARTLSCPAVTVFYHLHMALQVAFGWATTHSFDFAVQDPDYVPAADVMEHIQRLMATRRPDGQQDATAPREYLFRVVDPVQQTMFSGIDRMHEGSRRHPNTPEKMADNYKLFQLFDDAKYQGRQIIYTYDFGDNWEHYLTIKGRAEPTFYFECLDGSGHYVAEDVGSVQGWKNLKAAYRAARPSSEQKERRKWFEQLASNHDPKGLTGDRVNAWDREKINRDLVNVLDIFEQKANESAARSADLSRLTFGLPSA